MDNGASAAKAAGAGLGGFFMGMLAGAVVGGLLALFFAPQPGTKTREMVMNRYGQVKDVFRGGAKDISETAEKTFEQGRQAAREMRQST